MCLLYSRFSIGGRKLIVQLYERTATSITALVRSWNTRRDNKLTTLWSVKPKWSK